MFVSLNLHDTSGTPNPGIRAIHWVFLMGLHAYKKLQGEQSKPVTGYKVHGFVHLQNLLKEPVKIRPYRQVLLYTFNF